MGTNFEPPKVWSASFYDTMAVFHDKLFPEPPTYPLPWYGPIRNWLSGKILTVAEVLTRTSIRVACLPKRIPQPDDHLPRWGSTIQFREFGSLTSPEVSHGPEQ